MNEKPKCHTFDFHSGIKIDSEEIQIRHDKVYKSLRDESISGYSIASGNSIVIGNKKKDGSITIIEVTNGYKIYEYEPE